MEYNVDNIDELVKIIAFKDERISDLESDVEIKDSEIDQLEKDCKDKDEEIEKLEVTVSDLESKLDEFKNLTMTGEIIKQINFLTTDEVAKIYYTIQEGYHFQHLDKFKPL